MIKDAIANMARNREFPNFLSRIACYRDSESIIDRFFKLLLASDVPFRRLHRSVAKQKLDLFEFPSKSIAETGATATKIVGYQIVYAGPLGIRHNTAHTRIGDTRRQIGPEVVWYDDSL
jgi:hypothetical protein